MEIPSEKWTIMAINKIITIKGYPSILITFLKPPKQNDKNNTMEYIRKCNIAFCDFMLLQSFLYGIHFLSKQCLSKVIKRHYKAHKK